VGEFVRRRLGCEFLDYAINPFVAGVYAGDPARLSLRHAFPRLHALEQRYGSLIGGQIFGAGERQRRAAGSRQDAKKISFDDGLQVLIDALRERLEEKTWLHSAVTRVAQTPQGWALTVRRAGEEMQREHAAVLFAGTADTLAELQLKTRRRVDLGPLGRIQYPPVASVVLGFRREAVAHPLDGFGVLVPQVEGCKILGTLFSSSLFPNRAPAGHVTLTTYVGGARSPELALLDTESLVDLVCRDLRSLLGVTGQPTFEHHILFRRSIPQYEVGYGCCKDLMAEAEASAPGFFLAGNYRDGVSLSDSIVSGHEAAERLGRYLAPRLPAGQGTSGELQTSAVA